MTFILAEDEALHRTLRGMKVSDSKNPERPVGVWFGQPDLESQSQSYPYVTIDLINVSEAKERVMAGLVKPWYFEDQLNLGEDIDDWSVHMPTPINLDYQVTTYARQPRHDRQILAQIMGRRLPLRFGSLECVERRSMDDEDEVLETTTRRLDVLGVVKRDVPESGKRLFMNAFTVRVSSEVLGPFDPKTFVKVRELNLKVYLLELRTYMIEPNSRQPILDREQTIGTP